MEGSKEEEHDDDVVIMDITDQFMDRNEVSCIKKNTEILEQTSDSSKDTRLKSDLQVIVSSLEILESAGKYDVFTSKKSPADKISDNTFSPGQSSNSSIELPLDPGAAENGHENLKQTQNDTFESDIITSSQVTPASKVRFGKIALKPKDDTPHTVTNAANAADVQQQLSSPKNVSKDNPALAKILTTRPKPIINNSKLSKNQQKYSLIKNTCPSIQTGILFKKMSSRTKPVDIRTIEQGNSKVIQISAPQPKEAVSDKWTIICHICNKRFKVISEYRAHAKVPCHRDKFRNFLENDTEGREGVNKTDADLHKKYAEFCAMHGSIDYTAFLRDVMCPSSSVKNPEASPSFEKYASHKEPDMCVIAPTNATSLGNANVRINAEGKAHGSPSEVCTQQNQNHKTETSTVYIIDSDESNDTVPTNPEVDSNICVIDSFGTIPNTTHSNLDKEGLYSNPQVSSIGNISEIKDSQIPGPLPSLVEDENTPVKSSNDTCGSISPLQTSIASGAEPNPDTAMKDTVNSELRSSMISEKVPEHTDNTSKQKLNSESASQDFANNVSSFAIQPHLLDILRKHAPVALSQLSKINVLNESTVVENSLPVTAITPHTSSATSPKHKKHFDQETTKLLDDEVYSIERNVQPSTQDRPSTTSHRVESDVNEVEMFGNLSPSAKDKPSGKSPQIERDIEDVKPFGHIPSSALYGPSAKLPPIGSEVDDLKPFCTKNNEVMPFVIEPDGDILTPPLSVTPETVSSNIIMNPETMKVELYPGQAPPTIQVLMKHKLVTKTSTQGTLKGKSTQLGDNSGSKKPLSKFVADRSSVQPSFQSCHQSAECESPQDRHYLSCSKSKTELITNCMDTVKEAEVKPNDSIIKKANESSIELEMMFQKLRESYPDAFGYKCKYCIKKFSSSVSLDTHMKQYPYGTCQAPGCDSCTVVLVDLVDLHGNLDFGANVHIDKNGKISAPKRSKSSNNKQKCVSTKPKDKYSAKKKASVKISSNKNKLPSSHPLGAKTRSRTHTKKARKKTFDESNPKSSKNGIYCNVCHLPFGTVSKHKKHVKSGYHRKKFLAQIIRKRSKKK